MQLIIEGPNRLEGRVKTAGSKNAVLPLMVACLLADGPSTLTNVPEIDDVKTMAEIIRGLGATVTLSPHQLTIDPAGLNSSQPDPKLVGRIRASILLMGGLVARFGQATMPTPGGDMIGARPINTHLEVFRSLRVKCTADGSVYQLSGQPKGTHVLTEFSVTATENAILAAVLAAGTTEIHLAACEPHVVDLCDFLISLGAKIAGRSTHTLVINGVAKLKGGQWKVVPDQLEAGTFAIAAAATRGSLEIDDFIIDHNEMLLQKFRELGVNFKVISPTKLWVGAGTNLTATKIHTNIYPGFQTDLQAPLAVLLTQATGQSEIFETIYEGRLQYLYELQRMGANVAIKDAHTGIVSGPTPLYGTDIISFDLRAGTTLILAALIAEGRSVIGRSEHVDRGYEQIDQRLRTLGANIQRVV